MIKKLVVILFFAGITYVYLHNLSRDIYSGDIGDLVTAAVVGGVAHPPGYPLFTLLGYLLTKLPLTLPPVTKVGLISVISSLLGLIIVYRFSFKVTKSIFLGLLTTSILGFSYLFWLSAELPEVFALNNFFVIILFYLAYRFYTSRKKKYLYWLAFFTGLSLTHHHTILFLFPTLLILVAKHFKTIFLSGKNLSVSVILFLLGFSVYGYVFFAASGNPPINWDNPINVNNFLHLILRKDYGFAPKIVNQIPVNVKLIHVTAYLQYLITNFSYQGIVLFLFGMIYLLKKDKRLLLALLIVFILTGPFFVYYAATVVTSGYGWGITERFYIMSTVVLIFFVPYGLLFIKKLAESKLNNKSLSLLLISYFLIVPVLMFRYNFAKTELAKSTIGNTLASNVLESLPRKSVLFLSGDTTTFNIWYAYYVLGIRKDIDIINPPGVGNNQFLDSEINKYKALHPDIDLGKLVPLVFDELLKTRPVFTNRAIDRMPKDTKLVPYGLVFRIINEKEIPDESQFLNSFERSWKSIKIARGETLKIYDQNFITPEIPLIYSNALVRVGDFLDSHYQNPAKSEHYYRRALWIYDQNSQAYSGLALSQFKAYKDCRNALDNMRKAKQIYPIWKAYYVQLYYLYKQCKTNKRVIIDLEKEFKTVFNSDIEKNIRQ